MLNNAKEIVFSFWFTAPGEGSRPPPSVHRTAICSGRDRGSSIGDGSQAIADFSLAMFQKQSKNTIHSHFFLKTFKNLRFLIVFYKNCVMYCVFWLFLKYCQVAKFGRGGPIADCRSPIGEGSRADAGR